MVFKPAKVLRQTKDKKTKGIVKRHENRIREAAIDASRTEILETRTSGFMEAENDLEMTYKLKQEDIQQAVSTSSANKIFNLDFSKDEGPYKIDFSLNGKCMLIGGQNSGHFASFDWRTGKMLCESTMKGERIYDIKWLHNETMFAVAQSKNAYIYDSSGVEIHALRKHMHARHLTFLPYHMLLVSAGTTGVLRYQDMSTGAILNEMKTKMGPTVSMCHNPFNAIVHMGHGNGTVTLWSPNSGTPLVKMLSHRGPVRALDVHRSGNYMATAGADGQVKLWDIRTFRSLHEYYSPSTPTSVSFSQNGLLALTYGSSVTIWKDSYLSKQVSPYMAQTLHGCPIVDSQFCPYDDVLALGHARGISNFLIPGSGDPDFDSLETNPYETKKQRRNAEVRHILTKIQPEMISLDVNIIGKIVTDHSIQLEWNRQLQRAANAENPDEANGGRFRNQSSTMRRYLKRSPNVIDPRKEQFKKTGGGENI
jgi:U3 small nucleolar RNA-associated protein 7